MRRSVTTLVTACALIAGPVHAAPARAGKPGNDSMVMAAFEQGFKEGQALYDAGKSLAAARRWVAAADLLMEKTAYRDQRAGIYDYIVDAFMAGLKDGGDLGDLREAYAAIDAYCEGYTRAYGTETPLSPNIARARLELKNRLEAAEARATKTPAIAAVPVPAAEPAPAPTEPDRPWRPLVISGAVVTGVAGLSFTAALIGGAAGLGLTEDYDSTCYKNDPSPACTDLFARGQASNGLAITGTIIGTVLLATGVPLMVIGLRRGKQQRHALRPLMSPSFVGLGLHGRF